MTERQAPYSTSTTIGADQVAFVAVDGDELLGESVSLPREELIAYFKLRRRILIEETRWIERRYPETVS